MLDPSRQEALNRRLAEIVARPGAELSGLQVAAVVGGELAFESSFGRRFIEPGNARGDLPVERGSKFRVASISKTLVAIGAMILVERGLLELDRDISDYLGFELRNPHYPDSPITAAMLLSHTSSLRDGEAYNLPLGRRLREFFEPGSEYWEGGAHFAAGGAGADRSPGAFFCYCNLGFGVLGSIIEGLSGLRFDRFMAREVLEPLGVEAAFNVNLLSAEAFSQLATLYRKGSEEAWDPKGPWIPQLDDYRGLRPASACRLSPGLGSEALDDYLPGENGTLFSPQGGLRISASDLTRVARFLMKGGELEGRRLLQPASVARMMRVSWRYDPELRNGLLYNGLTRETGLGLMHTTASRDAEGGDRLLPEGGPRLWGHHGDAYGLLSGMLFEPEEGYALVYIIGGTGRDPEGYRGSYSSWFRWEEEIQRALLEELVLSPRGTGGAGRSGR